MGRKGGKKTGGRKKGTPNKSTLLLADLLDDRGLDPIEGLANALAELEGIVAYDPETQVSIVNSKVHIHCELLKYLFPKRKSIEHDFKDPSQLDRIIKIQWADEDEPSADSEDEAEDSPPDSDKPVSEPV